MFIENADRQVIEVETKHERDIWRASWAPVFDVAPINPDSQHIRDRSTLRHIGKFVLTAVNHRSQVFRRSKRQVETSGDHICLNYCTNASTLYEFDSGPVFLRPNTLHVTDYAHTSQGIHYEGLVHGILFPRCVIGVEPSKARPAFSVERDSPIGRVVYPIFQNIMQDAFDGDPAELEFRLRRLAQLLSVLLDPTLPDAGQMKLLRRAQLHTICTYIDKSLHDFEFKPDRIYRKFGVSRSTLYRMFLPFGGVRKYIQTRRTQRAVLDLTMTPYARGAISKVSDRWGFSSESNFSRAVRQTFGVSPGSLAGAGTMKGFEDRLELNMDAWLSGASAPACTR